MVAATEPKSVLQSINPSCDDAGAFVTGLNRLLQSTEPSVDDVEVVLGAVVVVLVVGSASAATAGLPLAVAIAVGVEFIAPVVLEPVDAVVAALPEPEPSRTEKSTVKIDVVAVLVLVVVVALEAVVVVVAVAVSTEVDEELANLNTVSQPTEPAVVLLLDTNKSKRVLQSTDPSWEVVGVAVSEAVELVLTPAELPKSVLQSTEPVVVEAPEVELVSDGKSLSQSSDPVAASIVTSAGELLPESPLGIVPTSEL